MADDRFPYNMPSRSALIQLVNDSYPSYGLNEQNTEFGIPYFSPTVDVPGRTYIEAENTLTNTKMWFVFRRLDIARSLQGLTTIYIQGTITPRKIVEEINRAHEMNFSAVDVNMSDLQLVPNGQDAIYRLKANPGSYVWYGQVLIHAIAFNGLMGVRLMEDNTPRLMEDDTHRLMEEGNQWLDVA